MGHSNKEAGVGVALGGKHTFPGDALNWRWLPLLFLAEWTVLDGCSTSVLHGHGSTEVDTSMALSGRLVQECMCAWSSAAKRVLGGAFAVEIYCGS